MKLVSMIKRLFAGKHSSRKSVCCEEAPENQIRVLKPMEYSLFDKWYYVPVREIMSKNLFGENWKLIGEKLIPQVPAADIEAAVQALASGGFLHRSSLGIWETSDPLLSTGLRAESFVVVQYQLDMLALAEWALLEMPLSEREIGGVTFSLSEDRMGKIKEEVIQFRKRILSIANEDAEGDQIFRCSVQLFPLSRSLRGDS